MSTVQQVNEVKYTPGSLNAVHRNFVTKTICIDSLFRSDYTTTMSSNFSFTLPNPITKVASMRLVSSEFPHSWYSFASQNKSNTFTIVLYNAYVYDSSGDVVLQERIEHKIVIPEGNYLSDDLEKTINNMFNNIGYGLDFLVFTINEQTAKSSFRCRAPTDLPAIPIPFDMNSDRYSENFYYEIYFNLEEPTRPLYLNAGWTLGFTSDAYQVLSGEGNIIHTEFTESVIYYNYLESESTYGKPRFDYFFIDVDDFNNNFATNSIISVSGLTKSTVGKNTLGRVSVDNGPNSIITTDNSGLIKKQRDYFGPVTISKLHIKILDKFGQLIDFNNNDYSIVLELDVLL